MTKQEAFNKVFDWLTRDGAEQCSNEHSRCIYLRGDGNRCAIGALLSEETLSEMGDSDLGIADLFENYKVQLRADIGEELTEDLATAPHLERPLRDAPTFLVELQELHDTEGNWWARPEGIKGACIRFAQKHDLSYPGGPNHVD